MLDGLEFILYPIIWMMEIVLNFYISIFSSTGLSIILLSATSAILLLPLQKKGRRVEDLVGEKMKTVGLKVAQLKGTLKGENLFLATEKIYEEHGYHPIQSIAMGASFFVMLPVLISALLLFSGDGILSGRGFLFIADLSVPDHLFGPLNFLPLAMFAVTFLDAKIRFKEDKSSQNRFIVISVVLLALVYNLPAGLVLYWMTSNFIALGTTIYTELSHPISKR